MTQPEDEHLVPGRTARSRAVRWSLLLLVWAVLTVLVGAVLFFSSSRTTTLAGHDAELSPTLSGHAVLLTGPVLPDVRIDLGQPLGVEVTLGKTEVDTTEELFARYALIASNTDAQAAKATDLVVEMAVASALRGAAAGAVPVLVYLILGPTRRREMWHEIRTLRPRPVLAGVLLVALVVAAWQPWYSEEPEVAATRDWVRLGDFLGDEVPLPDEASAVQVRVDSTTEGTKRLVASAVDTWTKSQEFYDNAAAAAAELELRTPGADETVALLVSDRHDNVGIDRVARAVADAGGATGILGGGDDTSTGKPWEAFSLDSMNEAFSDFDRWAVTGNHDHGSFVGDYLADLGWDVLDGEPTTGPGGGRLLGVPDPRSSGLGSWRDEKGVSFDEAVERVAEITCEASEEQRVNTLLVHDPNLGRAALRDGCVDLVVGGHHHVDKGPTRVDGPDAEVGYTFTNGTTGGAAYALAVGSKPRRDAQMTLVTYDGGGRPVGLQLVTLRTDGQFEVDDFFAFDWPREA